MLAHTAAGGVFYYLHMSSMTCTNCGAELLAGTKFCRQCGRPTNNLDAANVPEAPTRAFAPSEAPVEHGAPTQYINAAPTGPAYISPEQTSPPLSSTPTKDLAPVWRKRHLVRMLSHFDISSAYA